MMLRNAKMSSVGGGSQSICMRKIRLGTMRLVSKQRTWNRGLQVVVERLGIGRYFLGSGHALRLASTDPITTVAFSGPCGKLKRVLCLSAKTTQSTMEASSLAVQPSHRKSRHHPASPSSHGGHSLVLLPGLSDHVVECLWSQLCLPC